MTSRGIIPVTPEDQQRGESIGLHPLAVEPICGLYDDLRARFGEMNKLQEALFVFAAKCLNAIAVEQERRR